jgi:hypothetical protein
VLYKGADDNSTSPSIKTCGVDDCPSVSGNATMLEQPEEKIVYILLGVFLVFDVIGLLLAATFLPPLPKSQWCEASSITKSITSCFSTFVDVNMILVVPFIALMAMEQAILWTDFTKVSFKLSHSQENCMLISYPKWTIQRNCQHKTTKNNTNTQHNMCWTPLGENKHK